VPEEFVEVIQGLLERDPSKRVEARAAASTIERAFGKMVDLRVIKVGV
jgi:hypothetical protein